MAQRNKIIAHILGSSIKTAPQISAEIRKFIPIEEARRCYFQYREHKIATIAKTMDINKQIDSGYYRIVTESLRKLKRLGMTKRIGSFPNSTWKLTKKGIKYYGIEN